MGLTLKKSVATTETSILGLTLDESLLVSRNRVIRIINARKFTFIDGSNGGVGKVSTCSSTSTLRQAVEMVDWFELKINNAYSTWWHYLEVGVEYRVIT